MTKIYEKFTCIKGTVLIVKTLLSVGLLIYYLLQVNLRIESYKQNLLEQGLIYSLYFPETFTNKLSENAHE